METGSMIVSVIAVLCCLLLSWRGLQASNTSTSAKIRMALIWGVIILGLVIVIQITGLRVNN